MPEQPRKTIAAQADEQVTAYVSELAVDEKAKIAAAADKSGVKVGGAVDLGDGFSAAGHVEKNYSTGWGWFAGFKKRWLRSP